MKILLHACCGPCSLEPARLLADAGHELTLGFMNSNIHPQREYDLRLDTLRTWAEAEGIPVVEGLYDPAAWHDAVSAVQFSGAPRVERCRRCYHTRLKEAATWAIEHGMQGLSTTLAVSPYQFGSVIQEELETVCAGCGLTPVFQDFTPYYHKAVVRSRELRMYRQNYCGCIYSDAEAEAERLQHKAQRQAERMAKEALRAPIRDAEAQQRKQKQRERSEYDRKQHEKRAVLDKLRAQRKAQEAAAVIQIDTDNASTAQPIPPKASDR